MNALGSICTSCLLRLYYYSLLQLVLFYPVPTKL